MAKIDPRLVDLLKQYGEDNTSVWDCHGTWVAYHAAVERMAARAGILFDKPDMIVNDFTSKTVVVCVSASKGDLREWSFGECSPANNKNAYPYAMAEKRAKDRVALKLLGMSGLVYSEEEADDFKASKPAQVEVKSSAQLKKSGAWEEIMAELDADLVDVHTTAALENLRHQYLAKAEKDGWTAAWKAALVDRLEGCEADIRKQNLWAEMTSITTLGGLQSFWEESAPLIKALGSKALQDFTEEKEKLKRSFLAKTSTLAAG